MTYRGGGGLRYLSTKGVRFSKEGRGDGRRRVVSSAVNKAASSPPRATPTPSSLSASASPPPASARSVFWGDWGILDFGWINVSLHGSPHKATHSLSVNDKNEATDEGEREWPMKVWKVLP